MPHFGSAVDRLLGAAAGADAVGVTHYERAGGSVPAAVLEGPRRGLVLAPIQIPLLSTRKHKLDRIKRHALDATTARPVERAARYLVNNTKFLHYDLIDTLRQIVDRPL